MQSRLFNSRICIRAWLLFAAAFYFLHVYALQLPAVMVLVFLACMRFCFSTSSQFWMGWVRPESWKRRTGSWLWRPIWPRWMCWLLSSHKLTDHFEDEWKGEGKTCRCFQFRRYERQPGVIHQYDENGKEWQSYASRVPKMKVPQQLQKPFQVALIFAAAIFIGVLMLKFLLMYAIWG